MTREEAITELIVHLEHWKRLQEQNLMPTDECANTIDALRMAIEALQAEAVQGECGMIPIELKKRYPYSRDEDITDAFMRGYQAHAEAVQGWIPFTRRPMTEEEQKDYPNCTFMFDCVLPDDGDEILVSNGRFVWMDVFCNDIDGCYLDGGDDIDEDMAWMPLPKPYKGCDSE